MNIVKRAIIMAAGKGERLLPVTRDIPKPLVRVNGVRMIDTIIQGLHKNGIYEIYIVVGYLKEKFDILTKDYEGITLIENPYYTSCNNISSLYMAKDHLEDVMILDGDLLINDDSILAKEFTYSGYNAIWTDKQTDEWLMQVEDDVVVSCSRTGGVKGWQLFSISRWSKEDGKKLSSLLEYEFIEKKNTNIYWDDVAMFCHPDEFKLGIHEMKAEDVKEIDNFFELVEEDSSYAVYGGKQYERK